MTDADETLGWNASLARPFLESFESMYLQHQKNETLDEFWTMITEKWKAKFGNALFERESHHKNPAGLKKIKIFFRNLSKRVNSSATKPGSRPEFSLTARKKLQSTQAYSKLYYASKIKPTLEADYNAYREKQRAKGEPVMRKFVFMNDMVKKSYLKETDEVKAEVEAYRLQAKDGEISEYLEQLQKE
ncbi:hypothetical protein BD410DRAFT_846863, partial [Rickenella mellea]